MIKPYKIIFFAFIFAVSITADNSFADEPVLICGDPWAPFLYEKDGDEPGQKKVAGLHLENFALIEELTGLKFDFTVLPWKRCLSNVDNYAKSGDYEIVIDASFNKERAEKYYYVGPLYDISMAVFYSSNQFQDGPRSKDTGEVVSRMNEMQHYRICGLLGWNYEPYYELFGVPRTVEIDSTPVTLQAAFKMLSYGHCDVMGTHSSLVLGTMLAGELNLPKDIACNKLNEEQVYFHLMVAKKSPRALELVTKLSTALIELKRTRQWKTIEDKDYFKDLENTTTVLNCM